MNERIQTPDRRVTLKGWHIALAILIALVGLIALHVALRKATDELQQFSFLHAIAKNVLPTMTRVAELDVRVRAHLELAKAALAIERCRLATGQVPEKLEELVPQYLEQVPIDPFDGQPVRYRRTQPGYVLYRVDTDGQDNGGRERNEEDRDAPSDWCFIVTR